MANYELMEAVRLVYTLQSTVTALQAQAASLQSLVDAKPSRNILLNGEVTRINQRGFDGNWGGLAVGAYGYDRWKKADATNMSQVVEAGNFVPGAKYRLSGTGVTAATLTAPASGNWTVTVPQSARNIQLELGETATPFEVRNVQQELAMCQRYYEVARCGGWAYSAGSGGSAGFIHTFAVPKRITPTLSAVTQTTATGVSAMAVDSADTKSFRSTWTANTSGVAGFTGSVTASAEL